jgi:hypothetical protein
MDFNSAWGRRFIRLHGSRLESAAAPPGWPAAAARGVARVSFRDGRYPGLVVEEPYSDWSGYGRLSLTVYSGVEQPVSIVVRIDDAHHDNRYTDRVNRRIELRQGVNRVSIPLSVVRNSPRGRRMDLTRIQRFVLFAMHPPAPFTLYFDTLRLER